MWIKRSEFDALTERIDKLESNAHVYVKTGSTPIADSGGLHIDNHNYAIQQGPFLRKMPVAEVLEQVLKSLEELGLTTEYKDPVGGSLSIRKKEGGAR